MYVSFVCCIVSALFLQVLTTELDESREDAVNTVLMPQHMYVRPTQLITKDTNPITYQFITDYPNPHLTENHYIKPGGLVSTVGVSSKPLWFRNHVNSVGDRNIKRKQNILYVAFPVLRDFNDNNEELINS